MFYKRPAAAAAICVALAACGGDPSNGGGETSSLTLVGNVNLVLHPLESRTFQVLLAQSQAGPVANGQIHFELQGGDPSDGALDSSDVATGSDGVASVTFTAGPSATTRPTFKLVASTAAPGPPPVAFGITVIPVHRLLQIVGSANTRPKADGSSASATLTSSATFALKVRELDADTGIAITGDSIDFTLPPNAKSHWSGSSIATATAATGAGGEAQVLLLTTALAETSFLVQAASESGGSAVTFTIAVTSAAQTAPPASGDSGCSDDQACPTGYSCTGGVCQPPAGAQCDPAGSSCTSGFCCDGNQCIPDCAETCAAGSHCVAGDSCGGGLCASDSTVPDVTGVWTTRHDFEISGTLSFLSRALFAQLRVLDQAVLGALTIPGLPWFLQNIIDTFSSSLLQSYLPGWFQLLISIGDDLGTVLTNLRSEGSMVLVRNGDLTHLKGTEIWTSLVFYWLPLCGGDIRGDPSQPPDCARIDLATSNSVDLGGGGQCRNQALPVIDIQAQPFTATVTGPGPYSLQVDERSVRLEMGKIILVLVDSLIGIVSEGQYECIDDAMDCSRDNGCIVDCPGIASDISAALDGIIDEQTLESLCGESVRGVGKIVTAALANAWNPSVVETLQFSGSATIHAGVESCDGVSTAVCASQLGSDDWDGTPLPSRDGNWSGTFFSVKNLPGAWQATRPE
jgi:hypothetical protein